MKKKTRIAIIAVSVTIAGYALLQSIPYLIDKEALKKSIEEGLHKSTGVNFAIEEINVELTMWHGIQAHLNTTQITDMQHHPLGSVKNISVELRYFPLLTQLLPEIAKIHINHVRIPVGEYSLFKALKLKLEEPERTGLLKPVELRDTEILLSDYMIDDTRPDDTLLRKKPSIRRFDIEGKELSIKHVKSRRPLAIIGGGQMNYWLAQGSASAKDQLRSQIGQFNIKLEITKDVFDKKHIASAEDLRRLELKLRDGLTDLDANYRYQRNKKANIDVKSSRVNLEQAQLLAYQLSDTFGFPLPPEFRQYFIAGETSLDNQFTLQFKDGKPVLERSDGKARLNNVAVYVAKRWPTPLLSKINGTILTDKDRIRVPNLTMRLQGLPLSLHGNYDLKSERIDAYLQGSKLRIASLRQTASALDVDQSVLQGRSLSGLVDLYGHLRGTLDNPTYSGYLSIHNGAFADASQGIEANHLNGRLNFNGRGMKNPVINYDGTLRVNDGKLIIAQQGLYVNQFDGDVRFKGQLRPNAPSMAMPTYAGVINVRDARYQDPKTGLLAQNIRGLLRLGGDLIHIDDFKANVGGSLFTANGQLSQDFKTYQVRVLGNSINIPRFKQEVLAKIPDAQGLLAQLQAYQGTANINLLVSTGMNLNGRLDVSRLAIRTGYADNPIEIPALSVLFDGNTIRVPRSTVYYGPVAVKFQGQYAQSGAYKFDVDSGRVPLSFLRDNQDILVAFTGAPLPEIWNTAGDVQVDGTFSNRLINGTVNFYDAGLSWKGGDFPIYDMNGTLAFRQTGKGQPDISADNLSLHYGNSPVVISADSKDQLSAEVIGELSALTVNHFLVSQQSEATPYKPVPFRLTANGTVAGMPGASQARNDINAELFLDLNENFREAYQETPKPMGTPTEEEAKAAAAKETTSTTNQRDPNAQARAKALTKGNAPRMNINAVNVLLGTARTVGGTVGIAKGTVTSGVETLLKPAQILTKKILAEPPQEENTTQPEENQGTPPKQEQALSRVVQDEDNAFLNAQAHLAGNTLTLEQMILHLFNGGDVIGQATVTQLDNPAESRFKGLVLTVPRIDLNRLSQGATENSFFKGAKGTIGTQLAFAGDSTGLHEVYGWLRSDKMVLPYLTVRELTGRVQLAGETAQARIDSLKIPGVDANASARTDSIFNVPITLEDVRLQGDFVSIESLSDFNNSVVKPILVDQVAHNYLRPWQQGDPTSPVQFRHAQLNFKEAIYSNIIMSNLSSKFSLFGNSFFELSDTTLDAASGKVNGYLSMSPNDFNFTTLELNANGVEANALTKALLDVTGQIYGNMDGTVRFTTYGQSDAAMLENANGTVTMRIQDGRLPAIAKVETLLAAANVFRGGVLGLNLNNLLRSLTIYDTNYFAELSGNMQITNEVLYTQNLRSDGTNLDLLIQGSLRMDDGSANMLVNGDMSQVVAGKLGSLGSLSLGSLIKYIPALGTFGENRPGLLGYIPGVGYIPGFGGPAGERNHFQVRLVGQLEDPTAIQGFSWVKAPDKESQPKEQPENRK